MNPDLDLPLRLLWPLHGPCHVFSTQVLPVIPLIILLFTAFTITINPLFFFLSFSIFSISVLLGNRNLFLCMVLIQAPMRSVNVTWYLVFVEGMH